MLKALASQCWDFTAAAHLLSRAGFDGPPAEIERRAALAHEQAVEVPKLFSPADRAGADALIPALRSACSRLPSSPTRRNHRGTIWPRNQLRTTPLRSTPCAWA